MRWLIDFWKMRRRYGRVKIAVILFFISFYFIVQNIFSVMNYVRFANQNVEYVILVNRQEGVQKSDISKLKKLENIVCISPQKIYSVTCKNGAEIKTLPVTEVEAEYLDCAYGIKENTFEENFYLNESAWLEITFENTEKTVQKMYQTEELSDKNGQFTLVETLGEGAPMAYAAGKSVSFAGCNSIRMMCSKIDITRKTLENIRMLGYSVENEQEIQEAVYALEIVMLKLKYGTVIAVMAFLFGCDMLQYCYKIIRYRGV